MEMTGLFPDFIEMETSSFCNRSCYWCPNHLYPRSKSREYIKPTLFKKIVADLKDIRYSEKIALHNYNEPLLDPHILDHIEMIREELPEAKVVILSNGDFLDRDWFQRLEEKGVHLLRVTFYDGMFSREPRKAIRTHMRKRGLIEPSEDVSDEYGIKLQTLYKSMPVMYFVPDQKMFTSRGGLIHDLQRAREKRPCFLPFLSCAIDYEGQMKICCEIYPANALHKRYGIIGNLSQKDFLSLWLSERMNGLRRNILQESVKNPICIQCHMKVRHAYKIKPDVLEEWRRYLSLL
jgi:Radical SAM superfamily/Iron-sulfur cluster-binding domain